MAQIKQIKSFRFESLWLEGVPKQALPACWCVSLSHQDKIHSDLNRLCMHSETDKVVIKFTCLPSNKTVAVYIFRTEISGAMLTLRSFQFQETLFQIFAQKLIYANMCERWKNKKSESFRVFSPHLHDRLEVNTTRFQETAWRWRHKMDQQLSSSICFVSHLLCFVDLYLPFAIWNVSLISIGITISNLGILIH